MEEFQNSHDWSDWSADELVRELLDDDSPLFAVPRMGMQSNSSNPNHSYTYNGFISAFYTGPTIGDIGSSLSMTKYRNLPDDVSHGRSVNMFCFYRAIVAKNLLLMQKW